MRRFRRWRRRVAAAALLPLAAALTATGFAQADDTAPRSAHIDASQRSVQVGELVTIEGTFPGAEKARVEISYRADGAAAWHVAARTRTGANGGYRARVRPHRIGSWRAELSGAEPEAQTSGVIDGDTGSERISVRSRTHASVGERNLIVGDRAKVRGEISPPGERRRVVVRVGGERMTTHAGRDGHFALAWKPSGTGTYGVHVVARSNRSATGSRDSAGRFRVYRRAAASWYGPGLYGNALACGGTLSPGTMGVANRTLPCGTKVHLRYHGNSVTVPVIDRGPFSGSREYDLTEATKNALGFPDVGTLLTTR